MKDAGELRFCEDFLGIFHVCSHRKSKFTVFGISLILFRRYFSGFRIRRCRHFADFFAEIIRYPPAYVRVKT